jgi:hypothetical protein
VLAPSNQQSDRIATTIANKRIGSLEKVVEKDMVTSIHSIL